MRRAICLTTGEIVLVKRYDISNNIATIGCHDGRLDTVEAATIHFLVYPGYLKAGTYTLRGGHGNNQGALNSTEGCWERRELK
jgi:hypothetical protein